MKPTARLVNVARGGIVVEADLAEALEAGVIAGAALDVFAAEPTTESPLFGLPNVIVTPHLGASTEEAQDKAGTQVAEAVNLALAGEFVPTAVNVQGGQVDDVVKPFLPLGEKLGRLFTALAEEGTTGEVTIEVLGSVADADTRVLGPQRPARDPVVGRATNRSPSSTPRCWPRTAACRSARSPTRTPTTTCRWSGCSGEGRDGETIAVAGTVFQPNNRERLVEVWSSDVDIEPTDHMAFLRYEDRPGIIGTVGSGLRRRRA